MLMELSQAVISLALSDFNFPCSFSFYILYYSWILFLRPCIGFVLWHLWYLWIWHPYHYLTSCFFGIMFMNNRLISLTVWSCQHCLQFFVVLCLVFFGIFYRLWSCTRSLYFWMRSTHGTVYILMHPKRE